MLGRRRKTRGYVVPQGLPHQPDPSGSRRLVTAINKAGQSSGKGIGLPDIIAGGAHGFENFDGFAVTADISARTRKATGDDGMPPVQQPLKHGGEIALASQDGPHLRR
ncbi:MAG: hypothetical protein ACREEY_04430, partial [Brevundimonas sp.]